MKIAYYVCLELGVESGVLKKINRQADFWNSQGHETVIFYISSQKNVNNLPDNTFVIAPSPFFSRFGDIYLFKFLFRIFGTLRALKALHSFSPDIVYVRQVLWFPSIGRVLKSTNSVVEVNNNDLVELQSKRKLVSELLRYLRSLFFKHVDGVISVTNELQDSYPDNIKFKALTNSYPVPDFLPKKAPRSNKILFMSSPGQPWQGVDKILVLAKYLPEYDFSIVGWEKESHSNIPDNVKFKSYLTGERLLLELSRADYAIGPLALHRKNMHSTSAIKIGEYLSNNLPVILAYTETSISGDMLCVIDNIEDNITDKSVLKIRAFLSYWKDKDINRQEVFEQVDPSNVESQRLEFFEAILCR
ncbi:TPA: hypothetical protein ACGUPP_003730 [Vibrio vulnificus]|uniref:hypothetical protein n=1 Tax=Vibrio vulnificus TaxID=672 RepID=UPI001A1F48A5|nr:hypothetical protein [Vibrio vulnificus]HAS6398261.1 hypothetical protein [Vibrio vulnificus]HAS6405326.1 hypothetical protein [Vibrio vulnificus]HDY7478602.1 hypothetical protein [Vibrio vulnificus]